VHCKLADVRNLSEEDWATYIRDKPKMNQTATQDKGHCGTVVITKLHTSTYTTDLSTFLRRIHSYTIAQ